MKRAALALLSPPMAVCRFGCAGCCAAPIAVFWLAGIVSIIYGSAGGPANLTGPSWNTIGLGVILWVVASVWAGLAIRGSRSGGCGGETSRLRSGMRHEEPDTSDSFEEGHKAR
jgi:hypothetical protein